LAYIDPTIAEFKAYFFRDFPYGTEQTSVMDADIVRAFQDCDVTLNPELFANQEGYTRGFMLLAAHSLVMNLRASSQGISGQFSWLQSSKGVGSVSEGISIPQRILDNPEFSALSKTNYGLQYLMQILPLLTGQMFTVKGRTHA
jgi:hypothetical protein